MARRLCTKCGLSEFRRRIVKGRGEYPADFLFVGEAPGKTEDRLGEAFVGDAGDLLDLMLEDALKLIKRSCDIVLAPITYYITNTVWCRPCDFTGAPNRAPDNEEIFACRNNVISIYRKVRPRMTIFIGRISQRHYRTQFKPNGHIIHPAALLRKGGKNAPEYLSAVRGLADIIKGVIL